MRYVVSAMKKAQAVCAHNHSVRKRTESILQATILPLFDVNSAGMTLKSCGSCVWWNETSSGLNRHGKLLSFTL